MFHSVDRTELYSDERDTRMRIVIRRATAGSSGKVWTECLVYGSRFTDYSKWDKDMQEVMSLTKEPGWLNSLRDGTLGRDSRFVLRSADHPDANKWKLSQSEYGTYGEYLDEGPLDFPLSLGD